MTTHLKKTGNTLKKASEENPELVTFGCRLNIYESEVMRQHAEKAGLGDVMIFNTCAVTKEAERQARQAIRRARRENPDKKIIVTGCAAQINPETYGAMEEVDQVIGNDLKMRPSTWAQLPKEKIVVNDIMSVKETAGHLVDGLDGRSRAFLQVQQGCDHRCTFCIIPFGRGNSRSVPVGEIVDQAKMLVSQGFQEIVLTGVDVTSYGNDLPGQPTLGQMMRRLLALVPDLPRLRLSSLDPVEIDTDMWRLIENEPRLMPHLHLSMQAGDDMTLKRMKRRHLRKDIYEVCEKARALRPDIVFGADIIAGFPTENEEMFENTLRTVKECDLTYLHVFPYSERQGTPAARMPQVDKKLRKERARQLRSQGQENLTRFLRSQKGAKRDVVIEKSGSEGIRGRTEHFAMVEVTGDKTDDFVAGDLCSVQITGVDDQKLTGILIA